jgi:tetratricopeptide (TPR) repeat protein
MGQRRHATAVVLLALAGLGLPRSPASGESPRARLAVSVVDPASDRATPARVRLTGAHGSAGPVPDQAIAVMYGQNDTAQGFASQPDGAFYVDGDFQVELEPGTWRLSISKGTEYLAQEHEIRLEAGEQVSRRYRLERWVDMPERGWYSADDHIHIRRSPRENPLILKWVAAEDVHVGALLQMGDFWSESYFSQYAWGQDGVYQIEERFLTSGQEEPRTHALGHTISLAADDFVRFPNEYYHYDQVFDRVRELGGLAGYAHQATSFYFRGYRGMTLDVLRGKVDFLEVLQFCGGFTTEPMRTQSYYQFLDLGFPLTATAGSDFPWCGRGAGGQAQIGNARFYTRVDDVLTFEAWRESLKAGHTFVSSGPVIELEVNGALPGDELDVSRGSRLRISARANGHAEQVPLRELEIVGHGRVLRRVGAEAPGQSSSEITLDLEIPVEHGLWIAARCRAGDLQVAHTTPVYVKVDGGGFHNPRTAGHYLDLSERYLRELERELDRPVEDVSRQAWRYREGLEARIAETRAVIAGLRERFPDPPSDDPGPLAALPSLRDGWHLAAEGRVPEALAAYGKALELDPTLSPSAAAWSTLCWSGAIGGYPAAVLEACDRGLEVAPGDPGLQNARGLARALTGDATGARADFQAALDHPWRADRDTREAWIEALGENRNPFTSEEIERLRGR